MNKKIIAVALASLLGNAVSAWAEGPTVYGRLDGNIEAASNDKATGATNLTRLSSNASRFGVRGSKDLDGGLQAIYQAEVGFDLLGTPGNGMGTSRNSMLGLKGDFGTTFMGNWDTPYFVSHDPVENFGNNTLATGLNLTGRAANGATIANFNNHQSNVVQYWSPSFGGFQAKVAYAPDNNQTVVKNQTVFSASATYDNDAFYGAVAFENHQDGSFTGQSDRASRLVGAAKFGASLVSLTFENIAVGTSASTSAARTGFELAGKYVFGANHIAAEYSVANDLGNAVDTGASQYSLRYGRDLGKDTEFFGFYSALTNKVNGTYNFKDGAIAGAAGSKLSGFGVGIAHNF